MFGRDKQAAQQKQPYANAPTNAGNPYAAPQASSSNGKIETVIGANCRLSGSLVSDGGVRVEGVFEGQIQTTGNLIIAETAKVYAEVQAQNVVISGALKGNITANRVEITETGKHWGDMVVNSLLLNEGAYHRGQTNMNGDIEPPLIEAPKYTAHALIAGEIVNP
ncbi:MAG TPA: polymer-forming cytoskeletal protein [Thermoflexales bacterium]|nr:polymer-forming cytoskeletal protein [Thermoflexales bacterium]HQX10002.1 polymer-forming cytoskeletal protein [Thermoflexales bacterium]HQY26714.1 polymer-forming cytoskeletal protein [Thermoflexales bacterium]HQZ55073.1 polymer-forming cytoskeletal protein [Thermoflexales bacterium]